MPPVRRLAAILVADMAGYGRLMGLDEAGTVRALREHRAASDPIIAEHGGRVVKTTGDGILIEFGSVVGAVECALALQQLAAERNEGVAGERRMEWRIGVHLGDVLIEGDDILGDGVNIAARLEGIAEPNGICISDDAFRQVRGKVEVEFADFGEQSLKNIARPLRVYSVRQTSTPEPRPAPATRPPLPDKPSVAVLPFTNMSGDPEQEFFADGIAEDVITALSRHPSLFVIGRNSCFTYKGRAVEIRQIGRELGVRYVLEGSLRKAGNRIRVTAQLVEAESGNHVWVERYDRDLADIFAVQDEISQAATISIAPAIAQAEQQRAMRKSPDNLDAWAAYQRGLWHLGNATAADNELAETFFQQAIDLDPTFAGGYRGLAWAQMFSASQFQRRSLKEVQASAGVLARRAVQLDSADAEAHVCLSFWLFREGDGPGALAEAERALALSPNLANAHLAVGAALSRLDRAEESLAPRETSIRLDPCGPQVMIAWDHLVATLYRVGQYERLLDVAQHVIRARPEHPPTYRWLAAALGQLGRTAEARVALEKAIAIGPASFDMYVRNRAPWWSEKDYEHMLEGLRKVGWRET
jgi:adenylate cyclase